MAKNSMEVIGAIKTYGIRPVLHLSSGVKITGGEGTETSPYTLVL